MVLSVSSNGTQADRDSAFFGAPAISANGRYVAFYSSATNLVPGDTNGQDDLFVRDRQTGMTTLVSVSSDSVQADAHNSGYGFLSISADGRHVAFVSEATTLVPGLANGRPNIFVRTW
jgi:Tol biopolymer transport system component